MTNSVAEIWLASSEPCLDEMTLRSNNKRTVEQSLVPKRLMGLDGEEDRTR